MSPDAGRAPSHAILPLCPEPIQTLRASFEAPDGTTLTTLVRRWAPGAAGRCHLCRACTAKVGPDRQAICVVTVEGDVPARSAPLFSPDGLG